MFADAPPPRPAAVAPPAVLVVADARGFVHDSIPAAERALVRVGRRDGLRAVVPAWGGLIGARFAMHPPFGPGAVSVGGDVTTAGVPARFTVRDEFYAFDRDPARGGVRIVARLATGDRRPLAWRRAEGRGRVFNDTLGHLDAAWADGDPRLALVRAGLRWAAGVSRRPAGR